MKDSGRLYSALEQRVLEQLFFQGTDKIKELLKEYRGLRVIDLAEGNPFHSCVICDKEGCEFLGEKGKACPDCIKCSEDTFAMRYDF